MKILIDENVSNKVKEGLIKLKIKDVKHINDICKGIPDFKVFELASNDKRLIITGDNDFKANNYKYKIPIIWITPKARYIKEIPILIKWIIEHIKNYNIDIQKSFIVIRKNEYFIEYKSKNGIFARIKTKTIKFDRIKELSDKP